MRRHTRRSSMRCCLLALFMLGVSLPAQAGDRAPAVEPVVAGKPSARIDRLARRIDSLMESHAGKVGLAVVNLDTGESLYRRADEPMPTASLIKVAVMIEAYRQAAAGTLSLDDVLTLRDGDKVPGSGILTTHFSDGATLTLRDGIRLMIAFSDNTATNLVLDQTGIRDVNATMERLGCGDTSIHAKVYRRDTSIAPERSRQFGLGSTTARQMVSLFGRLHGKALVEAGACDEMLAHLAECDDRLKFRRHLAPGTRLAHKTGSVNEVRTDAGLLETPVGTIALCVLTADNADTSWGDANAGDLLCSEVAKTVYEAFSRKPGGRRIAGARTPIGPLAEGASGDLVADLQRTLNASLDKAAHLDVDGEFGPATKSAVEAFQRGNGLNATGIVGPETWHALGPIVTDETPVPDPAAIAAESAALPLLPAEDLDAPPLVTSAAWAIGDAATGEILWDQNGETQRDMASTTKIMTALVVLDLAERDPAVLDEIVTFSARADDTPGSTAGVRAGEQLAVRELLFGLMLPSGNDAAAAFAEHFGPRLEPPSKWPNGADRDDPAERFIAEMNRLAERIGLQNTSYRNPHGLTAAGHHSSAADLVRLASHALKNERFREVVSTRLHGCCVEGTSGYRRNIRWQNTNKLLGIAGYAGVKTGTTDAAGACLVSVGTATVGDNGKIGGDSVDDEGRLIIAVLGAQSSDARYVDTRNLFRWAWQQRRQP